MVPFRQLRAILDVPKTNFPRLLVRGTAIHAGLASHPELFITPNPSLFVLGQKLEGFSQAQQKAGSYTGSIATRNLKAGELIMCLEIALTYVQQLVDTSPELGILLIESAAMKVGKTRDYAKPLLRARQSQPGAPVEVIANVGLLTGKKPKKAFFNWQGSGDGGQTWFNAPSTPYGSTSFAGLTALETYAFRVSVTQGKEPPGPWSERVTFLVH